MSAESAEQREIHAALARLGPAEEDRVARVLRLHRPASSEVEVALVAVDADRRARIEGREAVAGIDPQDRCPGPMGPTRVMVSNMGAGGVERVS